MAARLACSPPPARVGARGSVELAGPRRAHGRGSWVRRCTPAKVSRPTGRAGGDARHGDPSSSMRCSGSASIFPVRQPKQGRADQQRRWRPAQRLGSILPVSSDCSPRTRPLQPWRSRRRSLTAPPPSCCCQPRPRPAVAADHVKGFSVPLVNNAKRMNTFMYFQFIVKRALLDLLSNVLC